MTTYWIMKQKLASGEQKQYLFKEEKVRALPHPWRDKNTPDNTVATLIAIYDTRNKGWIHVSPKSWESALFRVQRKDKITRIPKAKAVAILLQAHPYNSKQNPDHPMP